MSCWMKPLLLNKNEKELLVSGYIKKINSNIISGIINITCKYYSLNDDTTFISVFHDENYVAWIVKYDIFDSLQSNTLHLKDEYNIFESYSPEPSTIYANNNIYRIGYYYDDNIIYNINKNSITKIPSLNVPRGYTSLTYSDKYGLFVIGGATDDDNDEFDVIYNNCDLYNENTNKWITLSPMNNKKMWNTCLSFNDYLFECGKDEGCKTCSIYNINNNKWTNIIDMNFIREKPGIAYDYTKNRIFVGGGYSSTHQIEYYDIYSLKHKWINLPDTNMGYQRNPSLYINENGVIVILAQFCELYDTRINNNKWTRITLPQYTKKYSKYPYYVTKQ